ncbi:predicted protein [Lichtheimia corymbifera JMRC:FSU:9682]|uniref:F-box domain-containing protein n=1 Tax=Lichtheimia corymbifera JMRC:FSU:9682 TaxID=1263082 RepID=A0A068RVP7_9FUNG|nr:predicted protein [Lichtheimia corymbifera JMRC:FSU:9682]
MAAATTTTESTCWERHAHNGTTALSHANYSQAIKETTLALDELLRHQIGLLDTRSAAYSKTGHFGLGMDDAHAMMRLAPQWSAGYLRAGEICMAQGWQQRAIQVYDQGLLQVPASDAESHHQLQEARAQATTQCQLRMDIVGRLPFDILGHLVTHFSVETLIECLCVSHAWRDRLLGCPDGWQHIIVDGYDASVGSIINLLPVISNHIHNLSIMFLDNNSSLDIFKNIALGHFSRLRSLTLRRCKTGDLDTLLAALSKVSNTLTNLTISSMIDGIVPLPAVLSACPHLQSLGYRGVSQLGHIDSSMLPTTLSLTSLELEAINIRCAQLEPVLERCPYLRHLAVYQCEPSAVALIHRCCPQLESLYFNVYRMLYESETARAGDHGASRGLRTLVFGRVRRELMEQLLLTHATTTTVERLVLQMDMLSDPDPEELWEPIVNELHFPAVQSISITMQDMLHATLATIIQQCHTLTQVNITYSPQLSVDILLVLADLPYLRELSLHSVRHVSQPGIEHFFNRHRALGYKSPLRVFETDHVCDLSANALALLGDIVTLERIRLDHCTHTSSEAMDRFAAALVNNTTSSESTSPTNRLKKLELSNLEGVTDNTMLMLSALPSLEHLELIRVVNVTDQGIADLVCDRESPSLTSLWIYDCPRITKYMMEHVQQILSNKRRRSLVNQV